MDWVGYHRGEDGWVEVGLHQLSLLLLQPLQLRLQLHGLLAGCWIKISKRFIKEQHIFFTGSAARDGRVNLSPKGMDSLRILGSNRIL